MVGEDLPLTPEESGELARFMSGYGATVPDDKHNIHKFLHDVVTTKDTTKLGYLTDDEVGLPKLPQRSLKELALFCNEIADMKWYGDYFEKRAEILTSTSLSKNAKLLETAVTTTRQIADVTKKAKQLKKSWFGKKDKKETEQV